MLNQDTLARPYAQAAFEFAWEHKTLTTWSEWLYRLEMVLNHLTIRKQVLTNPRVTQARRIDLCCRLSSPLPDDQHSRSFVRLLSENQRFSLISAIYRRFMVLKNADDQCLDAIVQAPWPLSEDQQTRLKSGLTARFQRNIQLHCIIKPELLDGLVIRLGDTVIDGSLRGKLARLRNEFR